MCVMEMNNTLYELLKEVFEIDDDNRAKSIASKQDSDYFEKKFKRLEGIIGGDAAYDIVSNGKFADYRNAHLNEYLALASEVSDIIKERMFEPSLKQDWFYSIFYSIESLTDFMVNPDYGNRKKEILDPKLKQYLLFNPSSEQSKGYLNDLITNGSIRVGNHEHWSTNGATGTRENNILKKIGYELNLAFNSMNYEKPGIQINFGQNTITIDEKDHKNLRSLRDRAYNG